MKTKKKQHFVPQMFLKNFSIADEPKKCWEYNLHNRNFAKKRIDELCAQNMLYEIRDENGNYYYEKGKNAVENGFSKLEYQYDPFFESLFVRLEDSQELIFSTDDLELLYIWISFMIVRNPMILHALPLAAKEIGISIDSKLGKSYNFIEVMPLLMEKFSKDLQKGHIEFLESDEGHSFIISDIPVIIKEWPLSKFCYMPLSSKYALIIREPETVLTDIHKCKVSRINIIEVKRYNFMMFDALMNSFESELSFGNSLIANDESILRQIILPGV